jgi:hypothetical protein
MMSAYQVRRAVEHQMTRDKPEKNKITRMTRLNVISLTFRNVKIPGNAPATSAGQARRR